MSKYVKNLVADDIRRRLADVQDALLVNMVGLSANASHRLRAELRAKNVHVLVVKNSLAARATAGTPLGPMFDGLSGTAAVCWGSEDIVSLAKEITRILRGDQYPAFQPRGGVMDGQQLAAEQVAQVAKWPSRAEQLSLLLGQILSPGANLVSQLLSAGGALASQIAERAKGESGEGLEESAAIQEPVAAAQDESAAAQEPAAGAQQKST
ncbi:MAG: 50S ribosomal protein L10 [Thermoguttaceae bacterium]|jgi:ribosomal protein L10